MQVKGVELSLIHIYPETDIVNKSTNAMGILKAEEFVGVFLEYLKFYEHNGKARVRGYIPELPEGYEWAIEMCIRDSRDPLAVCELIKDYNGIYPGYKTNIVKCYDLGILTGFPDGEFKPNNILTRAEAIAVIRRLIDRSARKRTELPVFPNRCV